MKSTLAALATAALLVSLPLHTAHASGDPTASISRGFRRFQRSLNRTSQQVQDAQARVNQQVGNAQARVNNTVDQVRQPIERTQATADSIRATIDGLTGSGDEAVDDASSAAPAAAPQASPVRSAPAPRAQAAPQASSPTSARTSAAPQTVQSGDPVNARSLPLDNNPKRIIVVGDDFEGANGASVNLVALVVDGTGRAISNASVVFRVVDAQGSHDIGIGKTDAQGRASHSYQIRASFRSDEVSKMLDYSVSTHLRGMVYYGRGRVLAMAGSR